MIDCHTHILPGFDDGAKDMEMSLNMLSSSYAKGVDKVISTSHCYPKDSESILHFVSRRNDRLLKLKKAMADSEAQFPQIYEGCELNMLTDIAEYEETRMLCINNTDYLLVEMPSVPWKEWMIETIYKLTIKGYKPVMAHIDRFLYQEKAMLNSLHELDVLYQINAEAFLDFSMSQRMAELLSSGRAHVLGSDMHNLTDRAQCLDKAVKEIEKYYGSDCVEYFEKNAMKIIGGDKIEATECFKRKSLIKRIFNK